MTARVTRRAAIGGGAALGGMLWAGAAVSPARAAERRPLVVVVLDGGADGLSLAPPWESGRYRDLRGAIAIGEPRPFDGDFGLHPALERVAGFAAAGQVRLAPAAGSHTRTRSHSFERDVLESGAGGSWPEHSGWLNRAVRALGGVGGLKAVSLETSASLGGAGAAPFGSWAPGHVGLEAAFAGALANLYAGDPVLRGLVTTDRAMRRALDGVHPGALEDEPGEVQQARVAGRLLAAPDGPAVALLRLEGFDTHVGQGAASGRLAERFGRLDAMLGALRDELGPGWARTAVLVFTEFGRTAAVNGDGGADHGAGSAALLLGGAVRPGGVVGDWPGLAPGALADGRELAVTLDLRRLFKGVLAEHWRLDGDVLDRVVFPGSAAVPTATGLIGPVAANA